MNLTAIQSYFQGLAEQHADIRHGLDGRTAFFRLQGMGALGQLPNNIGDVVVQVERYGGRAVGQFEAAKMQQSITLRFGKLLEIPTDGDLEAAIDQCMGDCYLIMMDFVSKMRNDFLEDMCSWLADVDFTSMSWVEYDGPWLERHYGWDLNIPFRGSTPALRPEKWV